MAHEHCSLCILHTCHCLAAAANLYCSLLCLLKAFHWGIIPVPVGFLHHGPICHLVTGGCVICQPSVKLHRLRFLGRVSDTRAKMFACQKSETKGGIWRSYQKQRLRCGEMLMRLDRRHCYRVLYTAAKRHLSIHPISDAALLQCFVN